MSEKQGGYLTAADFYHTIHCRFDTASANGETVLEVNAGKLHKRLKAANRLSLCCNCLYDMQNIGDVILHAPSGGVGPALLISHYLPRDHGLMLEKSIYSPSQVMSSTKERFWRFEELADLHPVFRELSIIARQTHPEMTTRRLCGITSVTAELICKVQKIRIDNRRFGTVCGAIGKCGILSPEGLYALVLVRIIGNTHARKIPDTYLMTQNVFAYASYAFLIFADEVVETQLLKKKNGINLEK
ncbi:MAG TPA: hypothetical protein O0W88_04185 [Methanocorpusculum sp.]|nr:hypothetical protein [Methanocorpusculum sp.]